MQYKCADCDSIMTPQIKQLQNCVVSTYRCCKGKSVLHLIDDEIIYYFYSLSTETAIRGSLFEDKTTAIWDGHDVFPKQKFVKIEDFSLQTMANLFNKFVKLGNFK